ncbi:uncharacterized protein PAC_01437 [Phialocephala subalpina]|uniref:Uncharacterized protein n=1 Tax=Phialocephala subalpina TaxID=576137 RepID=A0A1L7WFK9_9HELO|nr:uncharacterized protein PAC_01437 [Phialocephala subalpina]
MLNPADTRTWINPGPLHHIWKDLWNLCQPEKLSALGLSRLLEISNICKSMDPRDKVYGLLGLIPAEFAKAITPDYDIETREVLVRSAKAYIDVYQSLELLRDANIWGESGAATWVLDWSWKGRLRDSRPSEKYIEGDMNPDTYVENPVITKNLSQTEHACDGIARELSIALPADASQSPKETKSLLHLPKTVADGIPIFESLGWKRFVTEGKFYGRWGTWVQANSSLRVRITQGRRPATTAKGYFAWVPQYRDG